MYQDRFDIVEAHLLAYMHCHGGQWTREYRRMCKILTYFRPGAGFSEETLTENGLEIYERLCAKLLGEDEEVDILLNDGIDSINE